jgi:hypothetical protein
MQEQLQRGGVSGGTILLIVLLLAALAVIIWLWRALDRARGQSSRANTEPPPPRGEPTHTHFAAGQVGVYATHAPGLSPERIAALVAASGLFPGLGGYRQGEPGGERSQDEPVPLPVSPDRVVTFDDGERAFSLVFADVPKLKEDEAALVGYIGRLNERIGGLSPGAELQVQQTAPNWYAGGAPVNNGTGGPGGKPTAPDPSSIIVRDPTGIGFWRPRLPRIVEERLGDYASRGAGIDVYILDTAPDPIDLERALKRWGGRHPLLDRLLPAGPGRTLEIDYAGHAHLLDLANVVLPDHDYVMSDHGLFIAGIIHALAPAARLHLVEVLNPYGVGTLESIARGFVAAARAAQAGQKVLVNASLFLDVARPDERSLKALARRDPFWASFPREELDTTVAPLREICRFLQGQRAQVVAAAGNDGAGGFHPAARVPAAFPEVLGVGALDHTEAAADYSNLADDPVTDGLAVFGGDKRADGFSDPVHGMLGVYIGSFPDGAPNTLGWARWAGTSFATPLVTGALAGLLSRENPATPGVPYTYADALALLRAARATVSAVGEVV